jgi:hypothetical protein
VAISHTAEAEDVHTAIQDSGYFILPFLFRGTCPSSVHLLARGDSVVVLDEMNCYIDVHIKEEYSPFAWARCA